MAPPSPIVPLFFATVCAVATGFMAYLASGTGFDDLGPLHAAKDVRATAAPLVLSVASICMLLYTFLYAQSGLCNYAYGSLCAAAKKNDGEKVSYREIKYGRTSHTLVMDRTVGNYLEQLPILLANMALYAYLVSASQAAIFGWCWLLSRVLYPFVFRRGFPVVLISTTPGYLCIFMMMMRTICEVTDLPVPSFWPF